MTLLQLQVFVAVCRARSFTKAGDLLNMTQSAVSQAIANLESELCVRLLIRDRNGITITPIGERILAHAQDMLQHTHEMRQESAMAAGIEQGSLRISMTPNVIGQILPKLISSFQLEYPKVKISLNDGTDDEIHHWLANAVTDIGIVNIAQDQNNVGWQFTEPFCLLTSRQHKLASQPEVSLAQLYDERHIQLKGRQPKRIEEAFKHGTLHTSTHVEVGDVTTLCALVEEGMGISIVPKLSIPKQLAQIATIGISPSLTREVSFVVRDIRRIPPICADFMLHAKSHITSLMIPAVQAGSTPSRRD